MIYLLLVPAKVDPIQKKFMRLKHICEKKRVREGEEKEKKKITLHICVWM